MAYKPELNISSKYTNNVKASEVVYIGINSAL